MSQDIESVGSRHRNQLRLLYILLYHNLGGEMIYILHQRLIAQKISPSKSTQVLSDIVNSFVQSRKLEMSSFYGFTSYDHLNLGKMKCVFESILSSSPTMKLTQSSFDKLYDLMVGVFKYQLVSCPFPSSLYHVTLNHLNSIGQMSQNFDSKITKKVHSLHDSFVSSFSQLTRFEWSVLRSILLTNVFATVRTRISVLLKEGVQDMETGSYVIKPFCPEKNDSLCSNNSTGSCCKMIYYNERGVVIEEVGSYPDSISEITNLGLDIYANELHENTSVVNKEPFDKLRTSFTDEVKETKLLVSLLGREKQKFEETSSVFLDLSFLGPETNETEDDSIRESNVQKDESQIIEKTHIIQPAGLDGDEDHSDLEPKSADEDLLALMDS